MNKKTILLQNITLILILFISFLSCEDDFSSIQSDVVNPDNTSDFTTSKINYPILAYTKKLDNSMPVQANGLPANLLGSHTDAIYGSYKASIVAQLAPVTFDPSFGDNVVLDSVVLTIPYYSVSTGTDADGKTTYELDSIYPRIVDPNVSGPKIKLTVYQNDYFLRDFNPDDEFDEAQRYYSDGALSISESINPTLLENNLLYESNDTDNVFQFSTKEIELKELNDEGEEIVSNRLSPSLRIHLHDAGDTFWQDLIFSKEGMPELSNLNNFENYFRGLYIKAEPLTDDSMILLNMTASNANLVLYYTSDTTDDETGETTTSQNNYTLNFSGNRVNIFNNSLTVPGGNSTTGDTNLYLKGGEGAIAILELLNGVANNCLGVEVDALDAFKTSFRKQDDLGHFITQPDGTFEVDRLINEAYIDFFMDQTLVTERDLKDLPSRIYAYDYINNTTLIDYAIDQTNNSNGEIRVSHSTPLEIITDETTGLEQYRYRIRITEHIKNIILNDSTNTKLGLAVMANISAIDNRDILNGSSTEDEVLPTGSILTPRGTVLYGSAITDQAKKVQLTIYYTQPDTVICAE